MIPYTARNSERTLPVFTDRPEKFNTGVYRFMTTRQARETEKLLKRMNVLSTTARQLPQRMNKHRRNELKQLYKFFRLSHENESEF